MSSSNDFYLRVFDIVKLIPQGKITTYGHIARSLGAARSSRLVGYAMNMSHNHDPNIPAHRVVNRNGMLTGKMHFNTPDEMQELLEKEGMVIENNCIKDFKAHLWDPASLAEAL